jgi:hypothetical protein
MITHLEKLSIIVRVKVKDSTNCWGCLIGGKDGSEIGGLVSITKKDLKIIQTLKDQQEKFRLISNELG